MPADSDLGQNFFYLDWRPYAGAPILPSTFSTTAVKSDDEWNKFLSATTANAHKLRGLVKNFSFCHRTDGIFLFYFALQPSVPKASEESYRLAAEAQLAYAIKEALGHRHIFHRIGTRDTDNPGLRFLSRPPVRVASLESKKISDSFYFPTEEHGTLVSNSITAPQATDWTKTNLETGKDLRTALLRRTAERREAVDGYLEDLTKLASLDLDTKLARILADTRLLSSLLAENPNKNRECRLALLQLREMFSKSFDKCLRVKNAIPKSKVYEFRPVFFFSGALLAIFMPIVFFRLSEFSDSELSIKWLGFWLNTLASFFILYFSYKKIMKKSWEFVKRNREYAEKNAVESNALQKLLDRAYVVMTTNISVRNMVFVFGVVLTLLSCFDPMPSLLKLANTYGIMEDIPWFKGLEFKLTLPNMDELAKVYRGSLILGHPLWGGGFLWSAKATAIAFVMLFYILEVHMKRRIIIKAICHTVLFLSFGNIFSRIVERVYSLRHWETLIPNWSREAGGFDEAKAVLLGCLRLEKTYYWRSVFLFGALTVFITML